MVKYGMVAILLFLLLGAEKTELRGKVVSVSDGDTCTVLVNREQIKVRLSGIDAPENKQPFGTKAKEHLAKLIHEKEVRVVTSRKDRYGRTLGTVYAGETNVNEEMIRTGFAWQYVRYDKSKKLTSLEAEARKERRGLWADPNPVEPWEWRKRK